MEQQKIKLIFKKIFSFIFIFLLIFTNISCAKTNQEKFVIEGDATLSNCFEIDNVDDLKEMIEEKLSFVLILKMNTCGACMSFTRDILNPYIVQYNVKIYSLNGVLLDDYEKFPNMPKFKTSPTIVIYNNGKIIDTLEYSSKNPVFTTLKGFDEYMQNYIIKPRLININEELVNNKLNNGESFILYIGWYRCGDCIRINDEVISNYLKENNVKIYYLEADEYRKNKPLTQLIEPSENATEEEINQYNQEMTYWNNWINFSTKYHFVDYRDGKVPALIYYENGIYYEKIIYLNDEVGEDGTIIDSFYQELIGNIKTTEEIIAYHNQKVIEFLNKNCN